MSSNLHTCFCCCTGMLNTVDIDEGGSLWCLLANLSYGIYLFMIKGLRSVRGNTNDEHIENHDKFTI